MAELGKAYVQIVPSAKGIGKAIQKEIDGENPGEKSGRSLGAGLLKGIAAIGIGAAVGKLFKDTISNAANYEQLIGGVDKLYGDASSKLQDYAKEAYKTSGLSMNAYMESATSFSAAMINSLGGDVQKAADMTDVAMRAMSDNANTFGTDMESVNNAFQGFAKQNYTMLDNLKLGYAGTKGGMQQLIADANEYAKANGMAADMTMDSFSDIVRAIDLIQQKQGIAGTTAKEAAKTFSGSFASMKAAAQNFLTSLGSGQGVTDSLFSLIDSAKTFFIGNAVPLVGEIFKSIGTAISEMVPQLVSYLNESGSALIEQGRTLAIVFLENIKNSLAGGGMFETAYLAIGNFLNGIANALPDVLAKGLEVVAGLVQGIGGNLPMIVQKAVEVIGNFANGLASNLPSILSSGMSIIVSLAKGVINAIPQLVAVVPTLLSSFGSAISGVDWASLGHNIVQGIVNGIRAAGSAIGNVLREMANAALAGVKALLGIHSPSTVFRDQVGKFIPYGMAEGVEDNIGVLTNAVKKAGRIAVGSLDSGFTAYGGVTVNVNGAGDPSVVADKVSRVILNRMNNMGASWA